MVRDQSPGVAEGGGFGQKGSKAINEVVAVIVIVIDDDDAALDSSADNMMEDAGSVYASLAWHEGESVGEIIEYHL